MNIRPYRASSVKQCCFPQDRILSIYAITNKIRFNLCVFWYVTGKIIDSYLVCTKALQFAKLVRKVLLIFCDETYTYSSLVAIGAFLSKDG